MKKHYLLLIIALIVSVNIYSQELPPAPVIADCEISIYPDWTQYLSYTANSFTIQITAESSSCVWDVETYSATWVHPSLYSGTGSTTITIAYDANSGGERTAIIDIEGARLTLIQGAIGGGGGGEEPPAECPDYEPKKTITLLSPTDDQNCFIQDGVIEARDYVRLIKGFSYNSATDASVSIKANPDIILPANYLSTPSNGSSTPSSAGEMGSLPGSINVSPSGAVIYTIQIAIPEGIAGVQPNLNITYNSQNGRSSLGKGFSLGGLSAIIKAPQSHYHDGEVSGLNMGGDERYVLDGNRLILTGGAGYGLADSEYRTEQDNFARIVAKDICHQQYFIVETKDGRTLEYGKEGNSSLKLENHTCIYAFYLNKVIDQNGNYMTYNYGQDDTEIWIESINYTGNSGQSPFNSIHFYYEERDDQKKSYISGAEVTTKNILREIVVKTNDNLLRKYSFKYFKDDIGETCLNEIILRNRAGEKLNSTIIEWGELNNFNIQHSIVSVPTDVREEFSDMHFYSADANSDGLTDLMSFFQYTTHNGMSSNYALNIYEAQSDLNGNITFNLSDLSRVVGIKHRGESLFTMVPLFSDFFGTGDLNLLIPRYDLDLEELYFNIDSWQYTVGNVPEKLPLYTLADLDNNGRTNIIYLKHNPVNGKYDGAVIETLGKISDNAATGYGLSLSLESEPKQIFTGDYNNDGLVDLRIVTDSKIYTYKNIKGVIDDEYNPFITSFNNIHLSNSQQGDFNGDGVADLLIIGENDENIQVAYGNGNTNSCSLILESLTIKGTEDPDTGQDDDKDNCIIMDFNNDGLSDFVLFEAKYDWDGAHDKDFDCLLVSWYLSTGDNFINAKESKSTNENHAYSKLFASGDFNGDGRMDLINYGFDCLNESSATTHWRFYDSFNTNFDANKVTAIYNGFSQKTEIKYRPLSNYTDDSGFYIKGTSSIDDVIKVQAPIYVVNSIKQPVSKTGVGTTNYFYKGLRVHNKGKGMLGFEKITAFNDITKIKQVNSNTLNSTYFSVQSQTSEKYYVNGTNEELLSKVVTNFEPKTYTGSSVRIFNHPVSVTETNVLTGVTAKKHDILYDNFGNVTDYIKSFSSDGVYDTTVTVANTYILSGAWVRSRLKSSTVTTKYGTETSDVQRTDYTYDTDGNVLTAESLGIKITKVYDMYSNITEITTSATGTENKVESFTYDPTKRFVKTKINVLGQTSTFNYNNQGKLVSETGIDGLTTSYTYDNWGRLKTITNPNGIKTTYTSDWVLDDDYMYYKAEETEGLPYIKTYYDYLGRKVRTETIGYEGKMVSDIEYNTKGQIVKEIAPYYDTQGYTNSHVTSYTYYNDGRKHTVVSNGITKDFTYNKREISEEIVGSGRTNSTIIDAIGNVINVDNNGTNIVYNYYSNGKLKDMATLGSSISLTYDDNGFKESLSDPNAGEYSYNYDVYGQLNSKSTPIGTYGAIYDKAGRIETETGYGNVSYTYIEDGNGINQLKAIVADGSEFLNLSYDSDGNISKMNEKVGSLSLEVSYEYDDYNRTTSINYPGGFGIKYIYDEESGALEKILTDSDDLIWQLLDVNKSNQITKYKYGNLLETILTYDSHNAIERITTGTIQDISYGFNAVKGRFNYRDGLIKDVREDFTYDDDELDYNQLKSVSSTDKPELNITVHYNSSIPSQIESKSDIGTYLYKQNNSSRPHAITGITDVDTGYTPEDQNITYTNFGKVLSIAQGTDSVIFSYGPDQQRKTMKVYQNDELQRTVYYFGNYEKHVEGTNVTELYYINAPTGLTAIYKKDNGEDEGKMYYVHKDHLGSIHAITDKDKHIKARYYYDPWGNIKYIDKTDGKTIQNTNDLSWLQRGYTGHEFITEIGLINMNGRLYDPDLGMFISPDPQLQAPNNPINFNRYAYVLNNPLVYSDPSGEFFFVVPSVSYSSGGLDVSLSVGVGISDVISAQLTIGYNFGNDNLYGTIGVSMCGITGYGGYGTQSGWMVGVNVGFGFNFGENDEGGIGSNITSIGFNGSEEGGITYNVSAWNYNDNTGWDFDPSIGISYRFEPFTETYNITGEDYEYLSQLASNEGGGLRDPGMKNWQNMSKGEKTIHMYKWIRWANKYKDGFVDITDAFCNIDMISDNGGTFKGFHSGRLRLKFTQEKRTIYTNFSLGIVSDNNGNIPQTRFNFSQHYTERINIGGHSWSVANGFGNWKISAPDNGMWIHNGQYEFLIHWLEL
jgi:RHS repeat-associated protein